MDKKTVKNAALRYRNQILSPYDSIMDMDGFDAICAFSETFSGASVYIPRLRTIFCQCLERDILNAWKGDNMLEIVQKYGFSERHVRNLLKKAV